MLLGQIKAQMRSGVRFAVGDVRVVAANEYRASLERLKLASPWNGSEQKLARLEPWERSRPYIVFKRLKEIAAGATAEVPLVEVAPKTEPTPAQLSLKLNESDLALFDTSLPGQEPTFFVYSPVQTPTEFTLADLAPPAAGQEPKWASLLTSREARQLRAYGQLLTRQQAPTPVLNDAATSAFLPSGPRR